MKTVKLNDDLAFDLLELSDKWMFKSLKEKCEKFLSKNLSIENIVDALIIGDRLELATLNKAATKFILKNIGKLKEKGTLSNLPSRIFINIIELLGKKNRINLLLYI